MILTVTEYGYGAGFAIIMGAVLLAVIIYTVIKLRKQVKEREKEEKAKND